jgi:hypothetical protein
MRQRSFNAVRVTDCSIAFQLSVELDNLFSQTSDESPRC